MIRLANTSTFLEIFSSIAGSIEYDCSYNDSTSTDAVPLANRGISTSLGAVTVVAVPAAATVRTVHRMSFFNSGSTPNKITIRTNDGTARVLFAAIIDSGESIQYSSNALFSVLDSLGRVRNSSGAGSRYRQIAIPGKVTSLPSNHSISPPNISINGQGSWTIGTPGVNGRIVSGESGFPALGSPLVGSVFRLTKTTFLSSAAAASMGSLIDVLWVNTALSVTLTTAQAITAVALPPRDINGTTNGEGVMFGIFITSAITSPSAATMSYTNSSGVAGRTATASAGDISVGGFQLFVLAAGDTGVRSVQSVTFSTSMSSGAISLLGIVVYDQVLLAGISTNSNKSQPDQSGKRVSANSCFALMSYGFSATTVSTAAVIEVEER